MTSDTLKQKYTTLINTYQFKSTYKDKDPQNCTQKIYIYTKTIKTETNRY